MRRWFATCCSQAGWKHAIEPRYRERIVVHEHYDLAEEYGLRGVHLKARDMGRMGEFAGKAVSFSCHSVEEAEGMPEEAAYCFLSPVFDSISKASYRSAFAQMPDLSGCRVPVVALGGITAERADACRRAGFAGVAVLGYLWEKPEEALMRFRRLRTPFVMSVAGFDPSSGAGVSADLKTFEATESYGLGVCTSITFQNEDTYAGTHWLTPEEIVRQCEMQLRHHEPEYVKIGLVESFEALDEVTRWLREHCPGCRIVWDPILKASAGHVFHAEDTGRLNQVLPRLYLVTPNTEEVYRLFGQGATAEKVQRLCRQHGLNVLWKGGHNEGEESTDCLITPEKVYRFTLRKSPYAKHGTGCMLSAALLSHLAQGDDLPTACNKAQVYVGQVIESNDSLLGYTPRETGTLPRPEELRVQYITAPKAGMTLAEQAEAVCRGGMRWVQLRMKGAATEEFLATGRLVKAVCHRYGSLAIGCRRGAFRQRRHAAPRSQGMARQGENHRRHVQHVGGYFAPQPARGGLHRAGTLHFHDNERETQPCVGRGGIPPVDGEDAAARHPHPRFRHRGHHDRHPRLCPVGRRQEQRRPLLQDKRNHQIIEPIFLKQHDYEIIENRR